jgi:hypothetical protein
MRKWILGVQIGNAPEHKERVISYEQIAVSRRRQSAQGSDNWQLKLLRNCLCRIYAFKIYQCSNLC